MQKGASKGALSFLRRAHKGSIAGNEECLYLKKRDQQRFPGCTSSRASHFHGGLVYTSARLWPFAPKGQGCCAAKDKTKKQKGRKKEVHRHSAHVSFVAPKRDIRDYSMTRRRVGREARVCWFFFYLFLTDV